MCNFLKVNVDHLYQKGRETDSNLFAFEMETFLLKPAQLQFFK